MLNVSLHVWNSTEQAYSSFRSFSEKLLIFKLNSEQERISSKYLSSCLFGIPFNNNGDNNSSLYHILVWFNTQDVLSSHTHDSTAGFPKTTGSEKTEQSTKETKQTLNYSVSTSVYIRIIKKTIKVTIPSMQSIL